jgi:macrolide-specific efflux system membrane fusion protein
LRRRGLWLIGALLAVGAGAFGYYWAFGKAEVSYVTAPVERGDVESTVVAAGILQPIKYVDVGAQASGKLKSLKVNRGDLVEENQLLAEIDPALADTALTSANATLENMTSQRFTRTASSALQTGVSHPTSSSGKGRRVIRRCLAKRERAPSRVWRSSANR